MRLFTEEGERSLKETKGLHFTDQGLPIFILSQVDMYPISGEMAHRYNWGHSMFHSSTLPVAGEDPISCERYRAAQQMLVDAGGDPRVKDKHGRKPADLCTPRTEELRSILRKEEYVANEGLKQAALQDDDEGPTGSASDSE